MTVYVLMGVSGTGKSTIGLAASEAMGFPFVDVDDLDRSQDIAKMSRGVTLSSGDRRSRVKAVERQLKTVLAQTESPHIFLACSALQMKFRKRLRAAFNGDVTYLHLHGDLITLKRRLNARKDHAFRPDMLAGQFAALEMPKRSHIIDIALPVKAQVERIRAIMSSTTA